MLAYLHVNIIFLAKVLVQSMISLRLSFIEHLQTPNEPSL